MSHIKLFESKKVRSVWNEEEKQWYFSVIDVIEILTDSTDAKDYWYRMKKREKLSGFELSTICRQLKMESTDGKKYATDCSNTKGLLRIIQSIPSPKAEPFKQWLANVGADRIAEIENPELASQRAREIYKSKGYPDDWIEKRMRSIAIREELTDEWRKHDVKLQKEYAILTAEISKATFGLTPTEFKEIKNLKRENLRDHMTDLELLFSMLGEASTTEIVKTQNPNGFVENKKAAKKGGKVAGDARKALEIETGKKVISDSNFLENKSSNKQKSIK
jgi:DNA-damage-inducible protein D